MSERRPEADQFNAGIIEEFRANAGRIGGMFADTHMILIHHIGAKSGIERVTPLAYSPQGEDRFVIAAANGGSPTNPDWYHNLKANPRITVEVGSRTLVVLARQLDDATLAELWPKLVAEAPSLGEFQARTARPIPVFLLTAQE